MFNIKLTNAVNLKGGQLKIELYEGNQTFHQFQCQCWMYIVKIGPTLIYDEYQKEKFNDK